MTTSRRETDKTAASKTIVVGTPYVVADEKAYGLVEVNLAAPDYRGKHRYQIVYVNRGDKIAEFRKSLGPARKHRAIQFRIPSLWVHSVAELMDIADTLRNSPERIEQFIPKPEDSTLLTRYAAALEDREWKKKGKTVHAKGK